MARRSVGREGSGLGDAVNPFAVLAAYRVYRETHFLAQRAADESPNAVGLPTGCLHGVDKQMHLGRRVSRYVSA